MENELQQLGFRVLAFSPDQPEKLVPSLEVKGLGYGLYSDAQMQAARALGIAFRLDAATVAQYRNYGIDLEKASGQRHHELPVPSVFLVAKGGEILWRYTNPDYRVRPENAQLLEAARRARAQ